MIEILVGKNSIWYIFWTPLKSDSTKISGQTRTRYRFDFVSNIIIITVIVVTWKITKYRAINYIPLKLSEQEVTMNDQLRFKVNIVCIRCQIRMIYLDLDWKLFCRQFQNSESKPTSWILVGIKSYTNIVGKKSAAHAQSKGAFTPQKLPVIYQ